MLIKELQTRDKNMLQTFDVSQTERISIIQKLLGRQGLQLLETLTQAEQEACDKEEGLFEILHNKFRPQNNETIKLLQFHKLVW